MTVYPNTQSLTGKWITTDAAAAVLITTLELIITDVIGLHSVIYAKYSRHI